MLKKTISLLLFSALTLSLLLSPAQAASVSLSGTVVNALEETVLAPYGGTVETIHVKVGDAVKAGDPIATLKTKKVYALQDGVARIFGETGESAEMITEQYGAVVYVEPAIQYTVSVSSKTADTNNDANQFVHPGETVYMRAVENMNRIGTGTVTTVSGGSFTVILNRGNFISGDTANVYRDPGFTPSNRLGKGSISVADPVAYTAEGIVVAYNVKSGDKVKKGDVLFETVEGAYAGPDTADWTQITAPSDGILSALSLTKGGAVAAGAEAATLYANEGMRVEAPVSETDLHFFHTGDLVTLEFTYLNDGLLSIRGRVETISPLGEAAADESGSEESWYTVRIQPLSTAGVYYGAHTIVSLAAAEAPAEQQAPVFTEQAPAFPEQ